MRAFSFKAALLSALPCLKVSQDRGRRAGGCTPCRRSHLAVSAIDVPCGSTCAFFCRLNGKLLHKKAAAAPVFIDQPDIVQAVVFNELLHQAEDSFLTLLKAAFLCRISRAAQGFYRQLSDLHLLSLQRSFGCPHFFCGRAGIHSLVPAKKACPAAKHVKNFYTAALPSSPG